MHGSRSASAARADSIRRRGIRSVLIGALAIAGLAGEAIQASPTEADETTADRLEAVDAFVNEQMRALHIPGLALALIEDRQIVYEHGYGVADTDGRPVTPDTPFMIGSTSKHFTGIAVQQLVRSGTLDLDAPVSRYLAEFQSADAAHRSITVRQLLGHISGFSAAAGVANQKLDGGPDDTLAANARRLAAEPLAHAPGATYEYSDANYNLLGYLVQEVTGMAWSQYLQQHVLDPLGMDETYTDKADAERAGLADGFYPWFGIAALPAPGSYQRAGLPAGYITSTAHDLARELMAQLGDIPAGQADVDADLLAAARVRFSRANPSEEYASGWFVHRFWPARHESDPNDPTLPLMYEHDGSLPTYVSFIGYVPERQFGFAITANSSDRVVPSRWRNFVFDTMRVAIGVEPRMAGPGEDLARQYARPLFALAVLLQLLTMIWSLRTRRRPAIGLAALANASALALMLIYAPVSTHATLLAIARNAPDLAVMTLVALLLAAVWLALLLVPLVRASRGPALHETG